MHDTGRGGHDVEVLERLLSPLQELVALAVPLELALGVHAQRVVIAEGVDLNGVVDDQIDANLRIDLGGITLEATHRRAKRGEIDHGGHAGEVLQDDAGRLEGQLVRAGIRRVPRRQPSHVVLLYRVVVDVPQNRLEQHLDRHRKALDVPDASVAERGQAVVVDGAGFGFESPFRVEVVNGHRISP